MELEEERKYDNIKLAIVEAVTFFDMFDRALTSFEIWQSVKIKCSLSNVTMILFEMKEDILGEKGGYYFLEGRVEIANERTSQYNLANFKFEIAKKAVEILRCINGVKMVAVCNNFYYKKESDIDLFIVVARKRMWVTRAMITLTMHLVDLRRHNDKVANMICLSFYVTEDALNLEKIALKDDDPYLYYWFSNLVPVYNERVYNDFFRANSFIKEKLPNIFPKKNTENKLIRDNQLSWFIKKINSIWFDTLLGRFPEKISKEVQLKKMSYNIDSVAREDNTKVIISDDMLKFHEKDRRAEFKEKLKNKL